jgi:hypothetical protein
MPAWQILLLAIAAVAGCGDNVNPRNETQAVIGQDVLRVREDLARNRLWVLTLDEVRIYHTSATQKRLIRKIALPNWSVVGVRNVCMPDLVLDRSGSAFIASNGEARLVRIDGDRFALQDFSIRFQSREGLDTGFGALAFAADGTLFARTTPDGVLWKIDVAGANATLADAMKKLPADRCVITSPSMTTQSLAEFERS